MSEGSAVPSMHTLNDVREVLLHIPLKVMSSISFPVPEIMSSTTDVCFTQADAMVLEIMLSDDGKGIKREHLSQVFHPFFTTKKMGTGLGLSICKKIIDAHNGTIEVKSVENEGTTFIIQLPVLA